MRNKYIALCIFFVFSVFQVYAQTPVSQLLYRFSPLGLIIARNMGLEDKDGNGVIDKGKGEGYEGFVAKYGNADVGFHANGVIFGADNGRLEENEFVNHYYINIRFKQGFESETAAIESEVKAYIYANNIPLVWLDDEQGTVMNAVNKILGAGWNEQKVSEDKAVEMFNRALRGLGIVGRTGTPSQNGGYYTLPEFVNRKSGYCFEVAQFGFWFFSELKLNSSSAEADLTTTLLHEVVKLKSGKIIDYFNTANRYNIANNRWRIVNPSQTIAIVYDIMADKENNLIKLRENGVLYDRYSLSHITNLMYDEYKNYSSDYGKRITLGEFLLDNIDILKIKQADHSGAAKIRIILKTALLLLEDAYKKTNNETKLKGIREILAKGGFDR